MPKSPRRRIVIGVIGGDRQESAARDLGQAVAAAGCILLTGGSLDDAGFPDEVKNAAMRGAADASGSVARLVGVLSGGPVEWSEATPKSLFLRTGLKHSVRNVINAVTPDAVIVFGGGKGTLAEAAFALAAHKPVFLGSAAGGADRLRKNFRQHFDQRDRTDPAIAEYLDGPLKTFPMAWKTPPSVEELKDALADFLSGAVDPSGSYDELVAQCVGSAAAAASEETGFPGLPGDPTAKARFETIVQRISE
jgi:uncharacterized protein (TIGR00725 family)